MTAPARGASHLRTPPAYTAQAAADLMGGTIVWGAPDAVFAGADYDSRVISPGQMFFATRGERTDGHLFLGAAAARGATCFVVEDWSTEMAESLVAAMAAAPAAVIQVEDTVLSVGRFAAHHRSRYQLPVIGVTGSVGKTTAKDMAAHILAPRIDSLVSEGNLNSDVSMPIVLLRLDEQHRLAVLEFATRGHGQLDYLVGLARPTTGVITEVAPVHVETLGSVAGVASAKAELLRGLPPEGVAIYNGDSAPLAANLAAAPLGCTGITFGFGAGADVLISEAVTVFRRAGDELRASLSFSVRCSPGQAAERLGLPAARVMRASLPYPGRHNALNAVAAALAAASVGVPLADGLGALVDFSPKSAMRLHMFAHHGLQVIDDAYNANPLSMAAALDILVAAAGQGRKAAVLADMRELGPLEAEAHRQLGREVAAAGVGLLVCYGPAMAHVARTAVDAGMEPGSVVMAANHAQAAEQALSWLRPGDTVLIKGSRGMAMEHVVEAIRKGWRPR